MCQLNNCAWSLNSHFFRLGDHVEPLELLNPFVPAHSAAAFFKAASSAARLLSLSLTGT
jgi:hypothetical protein